MITRRWDDFCTIGQRFNNSPLVRNRVMRMERKVSFNVGGFTIDLSGKSTVVLTTDSNVQKRYFPICFSFNRKLDRWLDIVQMMLQGLHKAGTNGRTHIIHISFPKARFVQWKWTVLVSQSLPLRGLPLQLIQGNP